MACWTGHSYILIAKNMFMFISPSHFCVTLLFFVVSSFKNTRQAFYVAYIYYLILIIKSSSKYYFFVFVITLAISHDFQKQISICLGYYYKKCDPGR